MTKPAETAEAAADPKDPGEPKEEITIPPELSQATVFTGTLIRQMREAKGLSLQEIAVRTRINAHILGALEEERFEDVPNARVYVRGFVRCLAREIGLDQDSVSRTYVPRWESWLSNHGAQ